MKKTACFILALCLFTGCLGFGVRAEGDGLDNFCDRYEYTDGRFADISDGYWYGKYVAKVYALGLMDGREDGYFAPNDPVTIAETITLAARLHDIYSGGSGDFEETEPWYRSYVDYALEKGIIDTDAWQFAAATTRRQFASILCAALPRAALNAMNDVPDGVIPDVAESDPSREAIYTLYRAGVLTGNDASGAFLPDNDISRSAVAAIISRMALRSMRVSFSLNPYKGPELPARSPAGDDFFSDACIIGNSLVEGIKYYSQLKTLNYYSCTGMTVISAMGGSDFVLYPGVYGSAVDAMSQRDYARVYIELGINEIGFPVETFTDYYRSLLERVRSAQPDADIYILSLTPVSRAKDSQGTFTMARVNAYNDGLKKLAREMEVYYIDCVSPLVDETGYLAPGDTWDGVHFNIPKYAQWEQLIRTHYVD